jgi:hypothetical protein
MSCALGALSLCACRIEVEDPPHADSDAQFRSAESPEEPWNDGIPDHPSNPLDASSAGGTGGGPARPALPLVPSPDDLPARRYDSLIVVDPAIVGELGDNANPDAPLSFRAQMQWLAGPAQDPLDFTRAWLSRWASESLVGPDSAPVTPRPGARDLLLDGWLAAAGSAGYSGEATAQSWADAPFQLIAIVNRVDLAADPCSGFAGELRLVYAAIDPRAQRALEGTAILELPYPTTRAAADWARSWSALGTPRTADLTDTLTQIARAVRLDADPLSARWRSNEIALAEPASEPSWELREFHLEIEDGALALAPATLEFTPREDVDPALLSAHVVGHADAIRAGAVSLPPALRAGAARTTTPDFSWSVLGVSESLRLAFSVQTCNGCHGGDESTLPFQHIVPDPLLQRPARLSRFLYDPDADGDELRRRATRLAQLAATECAPRTSGSAYPAP